MSQRQSVIGLASQSWTKDVALTRKSPKVKHLRKSKSQKRIRNRKLAQQLPLFPT
jgi:hypothetical protein